MFLLQKTKNNVRNFQQYFETEFLISPKLNEKLYLSHVFLDIWLQVVLFSRTYRWLTTIFVNPWKNQNFYTTNEIIFTKQDSFH